MYEFGLATQSEDLQRNLYDINGNKRKRSNLSVSSQSLRLLTYYAHQTVNFIRERSIKLPSQLNALMSEALEMTWPELIRKILSKQNSSIKIEFENLTRAINYTQLKYFNFRTFFDFVNETSQIGHISNNPFKIFFKTFDSIKIFNKTKKTRSKLSIEIFQL